MAAKTIVQIILDFMETLYEEKGEYKVSSKMVIDHMDKQRPGTNRQQVQQELSKLRSKKIIVGLGEKVPDQPGAMYFALASVLDKVTTPEVNGNNNVAELKSTVPAQTDKPKVTPATAHNPFDKVNSQLSEILVKLNGLAQGYSDIVERVNGTVSLDPITERLETIKTIVTKHITVDGDQLADVINKRLANLQLDDSFIYRVREEVVGLVKVTEPQYSSESLHTRLDEIESLWRKFATSENDDYKRGIKDGIRIAVDMGLFIPDGE